MRILWGHKSHFLYFYSSSSRHLASSTLHFFIPKSLIVTIENRWKVFQCFPLAKITLKKVGEAWMSYRRNSKKTWVLPHTFTSFLSDFPLSLCPFSNLPHPYLWDSYHSPWRLLSKAIVAQPQKSSVWFNRASFMVSVPYNMTMGLGPRCTVVDWGFCLAWSHSHWVPKKYTQLYINYKQDGLLAQVSY